MAIRHLRNRVTREVFVPALRLFRDTLLNHPDPVALREWAGRLEAALVHDSDVAASRPIALGHCAASWFEAPFTDARRVILYLHGGAFVVETPRLHGAFVTRLAAATGCGVLVAHYRLAPEHPFPAAPDDALTAYRWLLASGREGREIVVAGDSAGGNLALGLLQRIVHEGLPAPACAVALSPITDGTLSGESIRRNDGLDPMFTAAGLPRPRAAGLARCSAARLAAGFALVRRDGGPAAAAAAGGQFRAAAGRFDPLRTALPRRAAAGLARHAACVPAVRVSAAGARRTGRHRTLHRSSTSPNRRPPWNRNTTHRSTRSMPC